MASLNILRLFLVGIIFAVLIAAHPHDLIGLTDEDAVEETTTSGYNSAEEFMNGMLGIVRGGEEYDAFLENSTDYSSGDYD
ncbi:hypothetical protein KR009_001930, partial [Drosophila setifemur]